MALLQSLRNNKQSFEYKKRPLEKILVVFSMRLVIYYL